MINFDPKMTRQNKDERGGPQGRDGDPREGGVGLRRGGRGPGEHHQAPQSAPFGQYSMWEKQCVRRRLENKTVRNTFYNSKTMKNV